MCSYVHLHHLHLFFLPMPQIPGPSTFAFFSLLVSAVHGLNVPFERRDLERRANFIASSHNETRGFGLASGPVDNKQDFRVMCFLLHLCRSMIEVVPVCHKYHD